MVGVEAVIFDMDGVVIDSHSVAYSLLCNAARSFGCDLTIEEIKAWGSLSARQFWQRVKDDHGLPHDMNVLISSYDVDQEIAMYEEIGLIEGVKELLQHLKEHGFKTALATSASKKRMDAVLDQFELRSLFHQSVCDNEVNQSKPDPAIFLLAASKLGVSPDKCVVIEDSYNGMMAAKSAGMTCIGYKGLPHVSERLEDADFLISHFNELHEVLYREE